MLYDAIIVGGSFAGLSAATQLARAHRRIAVIDAGQPRNRFAAHSQGVLGHDGKPGRQLLDEARQQLLAYPSVSVFNGRATHAQAGDNGGFVVELDGGTRWFTGRRLLLATGIADVLPVLPGLKERWGATVIHCPYCHGYEINDGRRGPVGVLGSGAMSVHQALLLAEWGEVTLFTQGGVTPDEDERAMLARRQVVIEPVPVVQLTGKAPALDGVLLEDGRALPLHALMIAPRFEMASPLAQMLGCAFEDGPLGAGVRTDAFKASSVPGVFSAGDMARLQANITFASADGVMAGVALHRSLIMEEAQGLWSA